MSNTEIDDPYMDWLESHGEQGPPATDRIRLNITLEFDVARPDWYSADDALSDVLSSLADASLTYRVHESWGWADPPLCIQRDEMVGADGTIEAIAP